MLAQTARTILSNLGLAEPATVVDLDDADADAALYELVARELGSDWPRQVAPSFDARKTVLLDDRWASAREDVSRVALGELDAADLDLTGAGEAVARQAEYFGLDDLAAQARDLRPLEFADDIAGRGNGGGHHIVAEPHAAGLLQATLCGIRARPGGPMGRARQPVQLRRSR